MIGSDKIDFYILKLLNGKAGTIRVALNAVDRVGLRQVMVAKRCQDSAR